MMVDVGGPERGWVSIGPRPYLERLAAEYGLAVEELRARSYPGRRQIGDTVYDVGYWVHRTVLRSQGEFGCAGDAEALAFCREIAGYLVDRYGLSRGDAVAAVNRQWPNAPGRSPRVWIVGGDLAYHRTAGSWAERIFEDAAHR
jgi:hypothetical protein